MPKSKTQKSTQKSKSKTEHPLLQLQRLGQSPWHDNIRRSLLTSGALKKMIADGDITGLTSNPTIFEQAIAGSADYDESLRRLAVKGKNAEEIFDALAIDDIRHAADLFLPVYKRTGGVDGYVSIEVAPKFANNTKATIKEALRLWKAVNRRNLMVKIPATREGIPAIESCIAEGLNINVTLIFSLERYDEVMDAYIKGLTKRAAARKPVNGIASVASFFVSRVDTLVDKLLGEKAKAAAADQAAVFSDLTGQAAIANARLAYARFREKFASERFARLAKSGARLQRPLWASTSTKNPAYPDVYYVEALVGSDTVDTLPPATIVAYKDHGKPEPRLASGLDEAAACMRRLAEAGIDMAAVTNKLETDGVASFAKSYDSLIAVVDARREAILVNQRQVLRLGKTQKAVTAAVARLDAAKFGERLWKLDPTLWKPQDPAHQAEIKIRMGWLPVIDTMCAQVEAMTAFAEEVRRAGFTHALLCGMGGSSLAPEVLRASFGVAKGFLDLAILDSTDPAAILSAERRSNPAKTLYIIASKSGGTTEPNAFFKYFWDRLSALKGDRAGDNFIAITDPNTAMERTALAHGFRRVFLNPPEIGGRYAALSFFGLVPAALMGINVARLLDRARRMQAACGAAVPAAHNPGLLLGAILGSLSAEGRDKVTFLASPKISTFACWTEQLIAESTGKEGKGILPVEGEPLLRAAEYGRDRVFVHLRLGKDRNPRAAALARAGFPVIELQLADVYDLGGEFLRWEVATAAAGALLEIDPFDQPNVQESKDNTVRLLAEYATSGRLPETEAALSAGDPDFPRKLLAHLKSCRKGDYVALTAYVEQTPGREKLLRELRAAIGARWKVATTAGYGPRFLHSTGQLHKGGSDRGVFIQFQCSDATDVAVPGDNYSFGALKAAQALGDYQSLKSRNRRVLRVHLGADADQGLSVALAALRSKRN